MKNATMQRRSFLTLLGGAAAWPRAAGAQQPDDRVRALQMRILRMQAAAAVDKISQFFREIESQVGWTTQLPWSADTINQRRFDGLRLLRQVPAITEITQLDSSGKEELRQRRLTQDVLGSGIDYSQDPKFTEAIAKKVYYGPAYLRRQSEPFITLSVAGTRRDHGVSVVEVGLKLVWDVVLGLKIGEHGLAYVIDGQNRVIVHHDIGLVQRNVDFSGVVQVQAARAASSVLAARAVSSGAQAMRNIDGREILAAFATVPWLGWMVLLELPLASSSSCSSAF